MCALDDLLDNPAQFWLQLWLQALVAYSKGAGEWCAKIKTNYFVKNMAIKNIFLIANKYYTCAVQIFDGIILMARIRG